MKSAQAFRGAEAWAAVAAGAGEREISIVDQTCFAETGAVFQPCSMDSIHIVKSPADAFALFASLAGEVCERLWAVWVDDSGGVLSIRPGLAAAPDSAPLPLADLLRDGVSLGAAGLIVAHNHPGGDPAPSRRDIRATRQLADGASAIGIRLLDHVVVTATGCRSFRLDGLI